MVTPARISIRIRSTRPRATLCRPKKAGTHSAFAASCQLTSTVPAPKKAGEDQAIGRSRGGSSTKIHDLVDALANPVGFVLTGGQAHDLIGADRLLPEMEADWLIADKAYDAEARVLEPLAKRKRPVSRVWN